MLLISFGDHEMDIVLENAYKYMLKLRVICMLWYSFRLLLEVASIAALSIIH